MNLQNKLWNLNLQLRKFWKLNKILILEHLTGYSHDVWCLLTYVSFVDAIVNFTG